MRFRPDTTLEINRMIIDNGDILHWNTHACRDPKDLSFATDWTSVFTLWCDQILIRVDWIHEMGCFQIDEFVSIYWWTRLAITLH